MIIRVIKSKSVRWVGHVACKEGGEFHTCFWWERRWKETTWKILEQKGGQYQRDLKEILWNGVDCIHVAQDKHKRIKTIQFYKL